MRHSNKHHANSSHQQCREACELYRSNATCCAFLSCHVLDLTSGKAHLVSLIAVHRCSHLHQNHGNAHISNHNQQSRTANLCAAHSGAMAAACATMQVQNDLCRVIPAGRSLIGRKTHRRVGVGAGCWCVPLSCHDSRERPAC